MCRPRNRPVIIFDGLQIHNLTILMEYSSIYSYCMSFHDTTRTRKASSSFSFRSMTSSWASCTTFGSKVSRVSSYVKYASNTLCSRCRVVSLVHFSISNRIEHDVTAMIIFIRGQSSHVQRYCETSRRSTVLWLTSIILRYQFGCTHVPISVVLILLWMISSLISFLVSGCSPLSWLTLSMKFCFNDVFFGW